MKKLLFLSVLLLSGTNLLHSQLPGKNQKEAKKAYNNAIEYIQSGNLDPAISYLELALELDPEFHQARLMMGKVYTEAGETNLALENFIILNQVVPEMGEAWFFTAYLKFPGDSAIDFRSYFEKAINNGFRKYEVYYYRGLLNMTEENYTSAITDFTESIRLKEDFSKAYHERASAKRLLGDMQGALQDYRLATNYKHDFPLAFNNMASVKIVLGDFDGAIEDYTVAINLDEEFELAYNNRGTVYFYLGETELAMEDFETALSLYENYPEALNNKAGLMAFEARIDESLDLYDGILEKDEDFGRAFLNRGLVRELNGDLKGACEDWTRALELGVEKAADYLKECN